MACFHALSILSVLILVFNPYYRFFSAPERKENADDSKSWSRRVPQRFRFEALVTSWETRYGFERLSDGQERLWECFHRPPGVDIEQKREHGMTCAIHGKGYMVLKESTLTGKNAMSTSHHHSTLAGQYACRSREVCSAHQLLVSCDVLCGLSTSQSPCS